MSVALLQLFLGFYMLYRDDESFSGNLDRFSSQNDAFGGKIDIKGDEGGDSDQIDNIMEAQMDLVG